MQSILQTSTYCFWPLLSLHGTPTFHFAVEMYWNLIIPSSYDSLLCWLVWWLLWCVMLSQCSRRHKAFRCWYKDFFFLPPLLISGLSSHSGEQHRATGCASWGGSSCAEEHLRYGLPQGGQAGTCAFERHVCPTRLLQQYVSTSSCSCSRTISANLLINNQQAPKSEM